MMKRFYSNILITLLSLWLSSAYAATTVVLPNFTTLVEKYGPAVVNISTTHKVDEEEEGSQLPEDMPPQMQEFFKRFMDEERGGGIPREYDVRSLGSGFIISEDGYVVTNNHVIRDADQIMVRLVDQREFVAKVIGSDAGSDLALLKIDAKGLPKVSFGKSSDLKVGEWVLAIGSPFGFEHSATAGIVSAKGRSLRTERYVPFIQTDVAINPGNSGGPLFNLNGEVVGINSQILSRTGGYIGLSFAVPSDVAIDVLAQLKHGGKVSRGWLGVYFQEMDHDLAESFGLKNSQGALVAKVMPEGPAAKGGLEPGDVITAVNGKSIAQAAELPPMVGNMKPGTKIELDVFRHGKTKKVSIVVGELPKENLGKESSSRHKPKITNRLGVTVRDLKDEERIQFDMKNRPGVIIENVGRGPANNVGLQPGDIIISIGNKPIESAGEFATIVASLPANKSVPFLVVRPGQGEKYITLKLPK